jgi:hypothetical protein
MGPRSYRRSDERIQEEICEALTRHPGIDASDVDIRVENGEVTLTGEVEDRRARRLAEEITEHCAGVTDVHNELRARRGLGTAFGGQDREVSRSTTRESTSDKGTVGSATGTTTGATTGSTSGGTSGGATRGGRRGASQGTSSDPTQTSLRADAGTVDDRLGSGTSPGNSGGLPGNSSGTGTGMR